MTANSSAQFDSFVPVYDAVPESWDDARPFIVENLKALANAINVREIGFLLDQELLSGQLFFPGTSSPDPQQFRSVLRKVVDVSPLAAGAKSVAHGITFDANFSLIDLWVSATNSSTFNAQVITDSNVTMDATNININSPGAYDRAYAVITYIQET